MNIDKKTSVHDPVVVQRAPAYTITKGCLSTNNVKFGSLTASSSSCSFNIQVPSQNVFVDRKIAWTCEPILKCTFTATVADAARPPGQGGNVTQDTVLPVQFGERLAANSFPLHRMVNTISTQINDTVSTVTLKDILNPLVMLNDLRPDQEVNYTSPSHQTRCAECKDGFGALNNSLSGFFDVVGFKPTNGSFEGTSFCGENGEDLQAGLQNITIDGDAVAHRFNNGTPVFSAGGTGVNNVNIRTVYKFFIKIKSTEHLKTSPFLFNHDELDSTGLFGVNNMQVNMNFNASVKNMLQCIPATGNEDLAINLKATNPFKTNELNVMFHTPPLDLKLPSMSVVPYTQFPRYISTGHSLAVNTASMNIRSNTITLPSIPDCLIMFVKRDDYSMMQSEHYFPITKMNGITFDNYSGLCSSYTTEQLCQMSHGNGLRMDWNTWIGSARTPQGFKQTVGGFLILRMGIDIPLSTSQAAGVSGNYTLSVDVQVSKPKAMSNDPAHHPVGMQLVVMAPNSGFFATSNGSSQMVLNPLNETDVLKATPDRSVSEMEALTCGGGFFDDLAHSAQKHAKLL